MTPTCLFCGTLDVITSTCPTCGGNVYDVELAADRELVEIYKASISTSTQDISKLVYVPLIGPLIAGVLGVLADRRRRRAVRLRYTDKPVVPTDHPPYR